MPFRGGKAFLLLLLLLLASAGCQHALPVRTDDTNQLEPNPSSEIDPSIRRLPPLTEIETQPQTQLSPSTAHVSLVNYEQAEDIPAPMLKPEPISPPEKTLTLADLEQLATENNPTLAAALAKIESARGEQVQAGLYPNPVLGYHAMEMGNFDTVGQQGAFASQKFITGGKLGLDQAIADRKIAEADIRLQAQAQRVLSDVRVRFYDALVAQRRVELATELKQIGDNLVTASDKLLQGREGTENDLLQAEIRAEESCIGLENAVNEKREAWQRLATVLGLPCLEMKVLHGDLDANLPDYNFEESCLLVMQRNPEIEAARTRVERARIAIRRAEQEPVPDVDVMVSVRHNNITSYDVANVQVGMPIPVFNRNQGNIRSADAEWIYANRELQRIELDLRDRLAVTYRRYANARQQVKKYRDRILPRAKKSLDLVTNGYEQGQVEYLTLLIAQQTYIQVSLSYLDSLRELRAAASIIQGQLLSDSLTSK